MKRTLIMITAFALMLSLWSCAPAAKDDINSKPGGSPVPDSAPASGETPYVPEPADPEPTPNKPAPIEEANKTEPEDKYILLSSKFSQFVDSPIVLPKNYKPEIFEEAPAPETADGLYFGCRGINVLLTSDVGYTYYFYIISRSPINEETFELDTGLRAQDSVKIEKVIALQGYKENTSGQTTMNPDYSLAGLTQDWTRYAYLLDSVINAKTDAERYIMLQRQRTALRDALSKAKEDGPEWFKTLSKFNAYTVSVHFQAANAAESTETVKLTVNGKQYEVNCGIIRAENDSSANTGSALMTGMSTTPVVGPYRAGYPKATSSSILTLKAREQVTVTDIALRSATGLAEIENCSVTITDADGLATTTAWEKGDAFSVPAGGEMSISAMIYDPAAKGSIYAASMAVSVTYKTADGRTRRQSRQIQLVSNTSVYLMSLQQFDGVNMNAFYRYVYNPLYLSHAAWPKEYGIAYPETETPQQLYDYLAEFFKEK